MKLGPRARLAAYHIAVGHTLRSPSLIRAWANVKGQGRAGAAVRAWRADHPARFAPIEFPHVPAPVASGAGGGGGFEGREVATPSREHREEDGEIEIRPDVVEDLDDWIEWEYWDDPEAYDDEEIHGTTAYKEK